MRINHIVYLVAISTRAAFGNGQTPIAVRGRQRRAPRAMVSPFPQYSAQHATATAPTVLPQSQLNSPVSLEMEFEGTASHDQVSSTRGSPALQAPAAGSSTTRTRHQSGPKRNRSPPPRFITRDERKKVSRACDLCKMYAVPLTAGAQRPRQPLSRRPCTG